MIGGGGLSGINSLGILGSIPTLTPTVPAITIPTSAQPAAAVAMPTPTQSGLGASAIAMPVAAQRGVISDGRAILLVNPINPTRLACKPLTQTTWNALRRGKKHRYDNALAQYNACVDARDW